MTVRNTGAAQCPYEVEVCSAQGCAGDLSTLAPGNSAVVVVPASSSASQVLSLASPRLDPLSSQKIRWSNAGADDVAATLTVQPLIPLFADGFESGSTSAWSG